MFFSTRDKNLRLTASEAILQGLSFDGGLFLPEQIYSLSVDESFLSLSYQELAYKVLRPYLDDYTDEEVKDALSHAYDKNHFEEKVMDITTFNSLSIMELFHGQTLTFKDMALSLLPYLMQIAKSKHPEVKKIKILTATSGDTGSAVLSSFSQVKDINVSILYPDDGISPIQEKQMLYFTSYNARAYALQESNFDDCQSFVKAMLVKHENEGYTSANSINIGRLLPQIVYYYYTYLTLINRGVIHLGDLIDVVVPTGNFGDIFAGYLAKKMGLPIDKLVVASNKNRILTDFFTNGRYDLHREFMKTNSPSMDILISSNLERLMYFLYEDDKKVSLLMKDLKEKKVFEIEEEKLKELQKTFAAYCCDEEETRETIKDCYEKHHYVLDPHSAVSYRCASLYHLPKTDNHVVSIATASPLKFAKTIAESLDIPYEDDISTLYRIVDKTGVVIPPALKKILSCKVPQEKISKDEVEEEIFAKHSFVVKAPATSANLGPGFDVLGLAVKLYNSFKFEVSDKDELIGFAKEFTNENNLVLIAYQKAFRNLGLEPLKVKITQVENNIPLEGGLGSSSSCIVAGLLGANAILHHHYCLEELYELAIDLEGHPDNVAPCLFGGLVANVKDDKNVYHHGQYPVCSCLKFVLVTPKESVRTSEARKVLPESYPLKDVVDNLSHLALLPFALNNGDINLLYTLLQDKVHVPYRKRLIHDYDLFEALAKKDHLPFTISGSGSTMLYIVKEENSLLNLLKELKTTYEFKVAVVSMDEDGATIKKESDYE